MRVWRNETSTGEIMSDMISLDEIEKSIQYDSPPNDGTDKVREELQKLLKKYEDEMWSIEGSWYRYTLVGKVEFLREFLEKRKL